MIVADPGTGKTALCVNWAALSGARTLYCSADTDPRVMTLQLACLASGHSRQLVTSRLTTPGPWSGLYARAIQNRFPNFILDFSSAPSLPFVGEQCEALTELWGRTPELIVLDTASDVRRRADGWDGWEELWLAGRDLARDFGTVVVWAHHKNKVGQGAMNANRFTEIVIDMKGGFGLVDLNIIKNRNGRSNVRTALVADFEHGTFSEMP